MLKESGPLYFSEINVELGFEANAPFYIDTPLNRQVVGKPTGPIYLSDFYGRGYQDIICNANTNITVSGYSPSTTVNLRILYPVTLPTISVANYTVNGNTGVFQFFSTVANGASLPSDQYKSGSSIPKKQTTTLYAWYKVDKIAITLDNNWAQVANLGGIWLGDDALGYNQEVPNQKMEFTNLYTNNDSQVSKQITYTPTRNGYKFLGWATSESGSVIYQSNTAITGILSKFNNNTILYAQWQKL